METEPVISKGTVNIYLQGKGALYPILSDSNQQMAYFIGSQASHLQIIDHRPEPIQAAHRVIQGQVQDQFAAIFNQPAWYVLRQSGEGYKIDLHEARVKEDSPILWLGITNDGRIPAHEVAWEIYRPISSTSIAFVILALDQN